MYIVQGFPKSKPLQSITKSY